MEQLVQDPTKVSIAHEQSQRLTHEVMLAWCMAVDQ